jgi:hypothetical protein
VKADKLDVAVRSRDSYIYKGTNESPQKSSSSAEPSAHPPVLKSKPFVSGP